MYHVRSILSVKIFVILSSLKDVLCTIDGSITYRRRNVTKLFDDPCHPLYWYPRHIPDYCYFNKEITTKPPTPNEPPIPMPIPVPIPPLPMPVPPPMPGPPMPIPPMPVPIPMPPMLPPFMAPPIMPLPYPLPIGIPLTPSHPMLPVTFIPQHPPPFVPSMPAPNPFKIHMNSPFSSYVPPYGIQRKPMTMVPGLPGLVAPDGGINILPFSDVYADVLEQHKQKMIRKRLQKLLDEYDGWPSRNSEEDIGRYGRVNDITTEERF